MQRNIAPNSQMESLMMRLATFSNLPESASLSPAIASKAGFYYTGEGDTVACYSCGLSLDHWAYGVHPMTVHRRLSPECQFVVTQQSHRVPMEEETTPTSRSGVQESNSEIVSQVATTAREQMQVSSRVRSRRWDSRDRPAVVNADNWSAYVTRSRLSSQPSSLGSDTVNSVRDMHMYRPIHTFLALNEARLASFDRWPRSSPVTPENLARAGFYYTGVSDIVWCFFCHGRMNRWQPNDDPVSEHRRLFPECGFVRRTGGEYAPRSRVLSSNTTDTMIGTSGAAAVTTAAVTAAAPAATAAPENTDTGASSQGQSMICKVCLDADMNTVILPCGHLACCANCASALTICPICRHRIEGRVRTYMS